MMLFLLETVEHFMVQVGEKFDVYINYMAQITQTSDSVSSQDAHMKKSLFVLVLAFFQLLSL